MIERSGIRLDVSATEGFLSPEERAAFAPRVKEAADALMEGTCPRSEFLGCMDIPDNEFCSSSSPAHLQQRG